MWSQTGFDMSNTSNRWKKKGVKGKSSFSFHWATIAYVGGQGSEDSFVCVFLQGKEKERGAVFEDAPCVTPLSSLDTACLLFQQTEGSRDDPRQAHSHRSPPRSQGRDH